MATIKYYLIGTFDEVLGTEATELVDLAERGQEHRNSLSFTLYMLSMLKNRDDTEKVEAAIGELDAIVRGLQQRYLLVTKSYLVLKTKLTS
jgi:hypothetical protein